MDGKTREFEQRASLTERLAGLAETLSARESALADAERKIKSLTDHIQEIELEVAAYRRQAERRIEELNANLEHERATARDALDGKTRELEQGRASLTERLVGLAETVTARESALADAEQKIRSLSDRIAESEADAATYRAQSDRRIEQLNASLEREREGFNAARHALDAKIGELEQSRASLTERSSDVTGTLRARESALAEAERKIKSLSDYIAEIEAEVAAYRAEAERRIEQLTAALDRERFEFAVAKETNRRDYAQLQRNMLTARPAQQHRTDSDEVLEPARMKAATISTSDAVNDSKALQAKLAKLADEVFDAIADPLQAASRDASPFSAEPPKSSEAARPTGPTDAQPTEVRSRIAVFVSGGEKRVFVRQGVTPLFDMPVLINEPDRPLGTHVFTAMAAPGSDAEIQWNLTSVPTEAPGGPREDRKKSAEVPLSAAQALDRIQLPKEAARRLGELLGPGASLVISDEPLGSMLRFSSQTN